MEETGKRGSQRSLGMQAWGVVRFGVCRQGSRRPLEDCRWGGEERCEMLDPHPGPPQAAVLKRGLAWKQARQVTVTLVQEKRGDSLDQMTAQSQSALGGSRSYLEMEKAGTPW